jgi:hypothetical protein
VAGHLLRNIACYLELGLRLRIARTGEHADLRLGAEKAYQGSEEQYAMGHGLVPMLLVAIGSTARLADLTPSQGYRQSSAWSSRAAAVSQWLSSAA